MVSRDGVFLGMGISSGGLPIDAGSQVCLCLIHLPTLTCLSPGTTRGRSAPPLHMPDPPRHIQKHQTSHPSPITHHPSLLQFPPPLPSTKPSFPRTHTNKYYSKFLHTDPIPPTPTPTPPTKFANLHLKLHAKPISLTARAPIRYANAPMSTFANLLPRKLGRGTARTASEKHVVMALLFRSTYALRELSSLSTSLPSAACHCSPTIPSKPIHASPMYLPPRQTPPSQTPSHPITSPLPLPSSLHDHLPYTSPIARA